MSAISKSVTDTIRDKLSQQLNTAHLDIINESYMHNVPKGAETHFKVVVVSEKFNQLPLIKVSAYRISIIELNCIINIINLYFVETQNG